MTSTEFPVGQRVRFTADNLGAIGADTPLGKFAPEHFVKGDTGKVVTVDALPDGWIAVEPEGFPHLYVPVHPGMIEAA